MLNTFELCALFETSRRKVSDMASAGSPTRPDVDGRPRLTPRAGRARTGGIERERERESRRRPDGGDDSERDREGRARARFSVFQRDQRECFRRSALLRVSV